MGHCTPPFMLQVSILHFILEFQLPGAAFQSFSYTFELYFFVHILVFVVQMIVLVRYTPGNHNDVIFKQGCGVTGFFSTVLIFSISFHINGSVLKFLLFTPTVTDVSMLNGTHLHLTSVTLAQLNVITNFSSVSFVMGHCLSPNFCWHLSQVHATKKVKFWTLGWVYFSSSCIINVCVL